MTSPLLPPVAAEVTAEAVEDLSARLRKKLDAAVEGCGERAEAGEGRSVTVRFGEDAVVTLRPGPSGVVAEAAQAVCTCLLAPRCLHRAAALTAAPVADAWPWPGEVADGGPDAGAGEGIPAAEAAPDSSGPGPDGAPDAALTPGGGPSPCGAGPLPALPPFPGLRPDPLRSIAARAICSPAGV